ncbi:HAAS signaling domain-containing protein [Haloplasma contractile]|uniref:Membrane protein n=1 Tax=Haloplasma contractile SSD-17B TaxID=1033810 RepID=U2FIV8_9MOLU|nr:DUF1700 domain-containing protein [Haloplasma contractile]ERJ11194.1 putative membrane protein [Haloplasma contractile SSD-17B]
MNKNEFMNQLNRSLLNIPNEDRKEILFDYQEHFEVGLHEGRTEEDIANSLGNPRMIAKQMKANYMITRAEQNTSFSNIIRALFATGALGFFNFFFITIVFIPVVSVLFAFFVSGLALVFSGFIILIASIVAPFNPDVFNLMVHPVASFFLSIGVIIMGLLWSIGMYYVFKLFYRFMVHYLKINIDFIKNK